MVPIGSTLPRMCRFVTRPVLSLSSGMSSGRRGALPASLRVYSTNVLHLPCVDYTSDIPGPDRMRVINNRSGDSIGGGALDDLDEGYTLLDIRQRRDNRGGSR